MWHTRFLTRYREEKKKARSVSVWNSKATLQQQQQQRRSAEEYNQPKKHTFIYLSTLLD